MIRRAALPLLVAAGLGLLIVAAWQGTRLREAPGARADWTADARVPPGVRFVTVALGGFRGILADCLWLRATRLQDEGSFFEVAQLAEWITRLQPRYPEVWAYHAWNMAYNISVVLPDSADRWHWVRNGLRLLRDEGIPANASDPSLYWELGWLYMDKVGGPWDEAAGFYRVSLARDMMTALRGSRPDYEALARDGGKDAAFAATRLDPEVMQDLEKRYGPLDWRLPETHALYWGYLGRQTGARDTEWCARLVWGGVAANMTGGRLAFDPATGFYLRGPRLDGAIRGVREAARERFAPGSLVLPVVAHFLREGILYFHAFGQGAEAAEALAVLRSLPGAGEEPDSVEAFVARALETRRRDRPAEDGRAPVLHLLTQAALWRSLGQADPATGLERLARLHWEGDGKTEPEWQALLDEARRQGLESARR
jgi:hypothetical protein